MARWAAGIVFVIVAGLGTWAVLGVGDDPDPRPTPKTTTTTATTATTSPGTATGAPVVVVVPPAPSKADVPGAGRSLSDRVATPGVVLLAQLGVVLLAAFLMGAAVQRVFLGKYGFKIGTVEVPEVESDIEGLEVTIAEVKKNSTVKIAALARRLEELERRLPLEDEE